MTSCYCQEQNRENKNQNRLVVFHQFDFNFTIYLHRFCYFTILSPATKMTWHIRASMCVQFHHWATQMRWILWCEPSIYREHFKCWHHSMAFIGDSCSCWFCVRAPPIKCLHSHCLYLYIFHVRIRGGWHRCPLSIMTWRTHTLTSVCLSLQLSVCLCLCGVHIRITYCNEKL